MSSPASRRSQRNSQAGTPRRSARRTQQPPSSPPGSDAQLPGGPATSQSSNTPKTSRRNIVTSSPILFSSSPAPRPAAAGRMEISSPTQQASDAADGDRTPRARQAIGGECFRVYAILNTPLTRQRLISSTLRLKLQSHPGSNSN